MKVLFKILLSLILIFLFLAISPAEAQMYTGSITAESIFVEPGDQFSLELKLHNNNVDIAGIFIPMHFTSSDIVVDSVSFEGTIIADNFDGVVSIQPDNVVWVSYIPQITGGSITPIVAYEGLIATMYFSASSTAPQEIIFLDSINNLYEVSPGHFAQTNVQVSGADGVTTYYPDFVKGIITISHLTAAGDDLITGLPTDFSLSQNYPNPFNPSTNIGFALPSAGHVKLEIFNVLGQHVKTLVNNRLEAGHYNVEYDASDQASGIFFYRLTHEKGTETRKMILVK